MKKQIRHQEYLQIKIMNNNDCLHKQKFNLNEIRVISLKDLPELALSDKLYFAVVSKDIKELIENKT